MHLLVFTTFMIFPLFNHFRFKFHSSPWKNWILRHSFFQLFKLTFNLLTFRLLLIKFALQFTSHTIVSILSFFQIVSNLMHIGQSVQIFVLIQQLFLLFTAIITKFIKHDNWSLQFIIASTKLLIFIDFVSYSLNKLSFHLSRRRQVTKNLIFFFVFKIHIVVLFFTVWSMLATSWLRATLTVFTWTSFGAWAFCIGARPWHAFFNVSTFSCSLCFFFFLLPFFFTSKLFSLSNQTFFFSAFCFFNNFTFLSFLIVDIFNNHTWIRHILQINSYTNM